jgi:MFS family permease
MEDRRGLWIALASVAMFFTALYMASSIVARYSRDLGVGVEATSVMWSLLYAASMASRPFSGYVGDALGSYTAMSLGGAFLALSSAAFLAARGFGGLALGRLLQGLGAGFFIAPSMAAVASAAGERAGLALGYRSMMIALASLAAPPLAGLMADTLGYPSVFAAALLISAAIVALDAPMARRSRGRRKPERWRDAVNAAVLIATVTGFLIGVVSLTLMGLLQAHYRDLGYPARTYGYFLMVSGLSGLASRYLAGRLLLKYNPALVAAAGQGILALSMAILHTHYTVPGAYAAAALYGFGFGLIPPSAQLITINSVPEEVRNTALSIFTMGFDAGGIAGPLTLGYIAATQGYPAAYGLLALLPLTGIPLLAPLLSKPERLHGRVTAGSAR